MPQLEFTVQDSQNLETIADSYAEIVAAEMGDVPQGILVSFFIDAIKAGFRQHSLGELQQQSSSRLAQALLQVTRERYKGKGFCSYITRVAWGVSAEHQQRVYQLMNRSVFDICSLEKIKAYPSLDNQNQRYFFNNLESFTSDLLGALK